MGHRCDGENIELNIKRTLGLIFTVAVLGLCWFGYDLINKFSSGEYQIYQSIDNNYHLLQLVESWCNNEGLPELGRYKSFSLPLFQPQSFIETDTGNVCTSTSVTVTPPTP